MVTTNEAQLINSSLDPIYWPSGYGGEMARVKVTLLMGTFTLARHIIPLKTLPYYPSSTPFCGS